jgi:hypothetical protein
MYVPSSEPLDAADATRGPPFDVFIAFFIYLFLVAFVVDFFVYGIHQGLHHGLFRIFFERLFHIYKETEVNVITVPESMRISIVTRL